MPPKRPLRKSSGDELCRDDQFTKTWALWTMIYVIRPAATLIAALTATMFSSANECFVNPMIDAMPWSFNNVVGAAIFLSIYLAANVAFLCLFKASPRCELLLQRSPSANWLGATSLCLGLHIVLSTGAGAIYAIADVSPLPLVPIKDWARNPLIHHRPSVMFTCGFVMGLTIVTSNLEKKMLEGVFEVTDACRGIFGSRKTVRTRRQSLGKLQTQGRNKEEGGGGLKEL